MTDAPLTNDRQRTYTWADTAPALAALRTLSGLEFLRAIARGDLPASPIGLTLGMEPLREEDFTEGRAVFRLKPQEFHYNPIGSVHGGVFATLLDSALACAIHTTLPAGVGYTTLELKFNCVRPLIAGGPEVQAVGQVVAATRQTAIAEGRIVDEAGKLYAHATTTCLLLR
ncbi:PaaI family thioesterase [Deinococcus depolymerans]|uniref:Hotdog fold thioesterase n=2 Tax=Deinococcus TaxID=1298 RepID=A0ABN1C1R6_9DEIO